MRKIPQNTFLKQKKIENLCQKYFFCSFNFNSYLSHAIIYLRLSRKLPGRNFKKENKVSFFTFFEGFLILFLA